MTVCQEGRDSHSASAAQFLETIFSEKVLASWDVYLQLVPMVLLGEFLVLSFLLRVWAILAATRFHSLRNICGCGV